MRVWAMLDLLLTCETIQDARDKSHAREQHSPNSEVLHQRGVALILLPGDVKMPIALESAPILQIHLLVAVLLSGIVAGFELDS